MLRGRMVISLLVGGILLTLPTNAVARCSGSGTTFRCDPIVSESLRRKYEGLPPRYAPTKPQQYKSEGWTYSTPSGASIHRYKFKSEGRTYRGTIKAFPDGAYQHKGNWR